MSGPLEMWPDLFDNLSLNYYTPNKPICSGNCLQDYRRRQSLAILSNYLDSETSRLCNENFFANQPELNNLMRVILFDWILNVFGNWKISGAVECFQIIDRYLSIKQVSRKNLQLLGISAMFLSEVFTHDTRCQRDYLFISEGSSYGEMDDMIYDIVTTLNFRLWDPNINHYIYILESLNPDLRETFQKRSEVSPSYTVIEEKYFESIISVNFSCLPSSLQLAAILKHIGVWSDELSLQLRKSKLQVLAAEALVSTPLNEKISQMMQDKIYIAHSRKAKTQDRMTPEYLKVLSQIIKDSAKEESKLKIKSFSQYESQFPKIKSLGRGSYGEVFLSVNSITNTEVAIKKMDASNLEGTIENMVSEMGAYCYLNGNQGIIKIFDSFYIPKSFFVQELQLYDGTLDNVFKTYQGTDKIQYLKRILKPVFIGLKYLHERSFTHGDIKPVNILVDNNGEGVLADFGLAKRFPRPTVQTAYSEWFRDPEMGIWERLATKESTVDFTTDIWAIGASILKLFFDWDWDTSDSVDSRYQTIRYNLFKISDEDLRDLTSHMCIKRDERWTAEQCLEHRFFI